MRKMSLMVASVGVLIGTSVFTLFALFIPGTTYANHDVEWTLVCSGPATFTASATVKWIEMGSQDVLEIVNLPSCVDTATVSGTLVPPPNVGRVVAHLDLIDTAIPDAVVLCAVSGGGGGGGGGGPVGPGGGGGGAPPSVLVLFFGMSCSILGADNSFLSTAKITVRGELALNRVGGTTMYLLEGESGLSVGTMAILTGSTAGALGILASGGWYARRRWLGGGRRLQ